MLAVILVLTATIFIAKGVGSGDGKSAALKDSDNFASGGSDLVISKNEITDTASFYPIKVGEKNMEIMAVKASDGTIRTAFNTCQVCNGSPRAYYKQQGDAVVCQNCGNRFKMDMIEEQRGGCNPIPIMKEDKTDDGSNITISQAFIEKNKDLFNDNWKKQ
ncbi:MAG: DUF2318 domain-containing protein [Clostridiaceae bacterium]|nr:DUF2318 domain-containing protein [Clostridiaceae bacterium]